LAAEPFLTGPGERGDFARELKIGDAVPRSPLAFLPPMRFPRMSAQSSRFTIHPHPAEGSTIESVLRGSREIMRYEIPGGYKPSLARDLTALEFTAETLFRSLDALSTTIEAEVYAADLGEGYPDPPLFD
jgi:hypothetical protein